MKLKKRTEIDRPGVVYNLHVENIHNYVANGAVVSNCQDAKGKVLDQILAGPGKNIPFRFGCTGTLPEQSLFQRQIKSVLGEVMFDLPAWKLQADGVLATSMIHQIEFDDKTKAYRDFKKQFDEDNEMTWNDILTWQVVTEERIAMMAELISEISLGGPSLVLVPLKKYGKKLENLIPNSIYLDGDVDSKERDRVFAEFNKVDSGTLICTSHIASVGIDIPRLTNVVMIELGKQFVKILQSIGRGLRKEGDKSHVDIWDFHSNQDSSAKHAKERQRLYRKAKQDFEETKIGY